MNFAKLSKKMGFSLVELMTVVALISVLSVIVYPSYKEYIVRQKVLRAMKVGDQVKNLMVNYYIENGIFTNAGGLGIGSDYTIDTSFYQGEAAINWFRLQTTTTGDCQADTCADLIYDFDESYLGIGALLQIWIRYDILDGQITFTCGVHSSNLANDNGNIKYAPKECQKLANHYL